MMGKLRQALAALSVKADQATVARTARQAAVLAAKLLRNPASIGKNLESLAGVMEIHVRETGSWVGPDSIAAGEGGPFDACDLRHWLELARRAGVPFVEAKEILSLEEEELSALSGGVTMPDTPLIRGIERRKRLLAPFIGDHGEARPASPDLEALVERLHEAMDDVPEGWMVRYARCGGSRLKTLAGAGVAGPEAPEIRFGPDLELGPGWVRRGNRRMVEVSDQRTVEAAAQGPGGKAAFLARPWVPAARFVSGDDPHRHGTPFAGKGFWPAEWRAFVERGEVVGVSWYYGWCGEATPENAAIAMEVRHLAQAIVDEAVKLRAWPRWMDVEFVRLSGNRDLLSRPEVSAALEVFGREDVACTLDFIETGEGLALLEGGPPNTPFGGGHPCAFAGVGGQPKFGNRTSVRGVAFRTMPHVVLGDPSTWTEGDVEGCILSWEEAEALAVYQPAP